MASTDREQLLSSAKKLLALRRAKLTNYVPYPKQSDFHRSGSTRKERLLLAGNRCGKTTCASFEIAMHMTGHYPAWWEGRRFLTPTKGYIASTTAEKTMEAAQAMMLGENQDWGTGAIPAANIQKVTMSRSTTGAVDQFQVKHVSGGISSAMFKSYKEGAANFASTELHWAWLDEEPPYDVYSECLTRLNTTNGAMLLTLTSKLGLTQVLSLFYPTPNTLDRGIVVMTINDVLHFDDAQREKMVAQYQPWERDAILYGGVMRGEGLVYPIAEWEICEKAFHVPDHWTQLGGLDFGSGTEIGHPSAAVRCAFDGDADRMWVVDAWRTKEGGPGQHAIALRPWGDWLPWAWPHDGERKVDFTDGSSKTIADMYRGHGLRMLPKHATFQDGGYGREAAVSEILERMQSGRFKVFDHLSAWLEEFRMYHRKDLKIVRDRDDLMSATEKALMMRRFARRKGGASIRMPGVIGMDYDPLQPGRGKSEGEAPYGWES